MSNQETREAYQGDIEAKLQEWGAKLDQLKAKADTINDDAKAEIDEKINILTIKKENLEIKLAELKSSSGDAWESLKLGFQSAWNELTFAFEDAISKFSK